MKLFEKLCRGRYSVCCRCKVHFEPPTEVLDKLFGQFCPTHRAEPMKRWERERAVVNWAARNWERLEEQANKEESERREKENVCKRRDGPTVFQI